MDIQENEGPSKLKGASKVFKKWWQESLWQIEDIPVFITMTHRDKCTFCEQYAEHAVAALEKLTVEILSHWIELAFQMVWQCVVACIEDDAMDEAHSKLSWYCDWYQNVIKNTKSLQEQLDSKKECCHKTESKLHHLQKEGKGKGKQREVSATCKWHEWESIMDSDIAVLLFVKQAHICSRWMTGPVLKDLESAEVHIC